ncbi:MAG: ankyrin repeat domain-containing protein, partial [Planctomycetes bacterium]|nr:ankyrin repeat domain-containing protein [Planctomycetota bacterium]
LLRKNGGKTGAQLGGLEGGDIWAAARSGDVEALRNHVKPGADINKKDQFGTTALHWAVALGRVEAVKFLLQKGADVNESNNEGKTPLDETFEPWSRLAVDFIRNFFRVETDPAEVNAGRKAIQPLLKVKGAKRGSEIEK